MKQDMTHRMSNKNSLRIPAMRTRMVLAGLVLLLTGGNAAAQGVVVHGNVFGGGNLAEVGGSVTVNIKAGAVDKDVYGGGALANTNTNNTTDPSANTTTVNLLGGTISGDAYGGGLGQKKDFAGITGEIATEDKAAVVHGDINVNLGSASESVTTATAFNISYDNSGTTDNPVQVVKSGRIFGCNNLNGSPLGNVTVTVYRTVKGNTDKTPSDKLKSKVEDDHSYHLAAVYGGGNLADYSTTGKKTHVIIKGCDLTSILTVYGGGNAAAVPETDVDVYGSYEIGNVFGGGNGKDKFKKGNTWTLNPGANVNGNANTMLYGGLIHEAFGGSNEKGRITGNVAINTDPQGTCTLDVGTIYGAGKNADIDGDLIVTLGCMSENKKTDAVYGGAENANVKGNVELTITSGKFGKVFGGNNQSGAIFGSITLNIMESGCSPIEIDELYLGGNQAAYSVYGYYKAIRYEKEGKYYLDASYKTPLYVNGSNLYLDEDKEKRLYPKAETVGTETITYLYLDEECTKPFYMPRTSASDSNAAVFFGIPSTDEDHTKPNTTTGQYADPVLNIVSATKIGKVFGGGLGSGAALYGNPTVNINQAYPLTWAGYSEGVTTYQKKDETFGAIGGGYKDENNQDVEGGIFGGGNEAAVYGNTTLNIGTKTTVDWKVLVLDNYKKPILDENGKFRTQTLTGADYNTVIGANIAGNVYGGGNQADVTGNTFVNVCAEKSGTTYNAVAEGSKKVTIAGNVFGGGKGVADNFLCDKAMVGTNDKGLEDNYTDGNTSVIIGNGTVNRNVYGGGEVGRVEMNTTVTVGLPGTVTSSPDIKGDVFGGGMGDKEHGYAGLVRGNPTVTIQANTKVEHNVYGGGEIASVARYKVPRTDEELAAAHNAGYTDAVKGRPYALKDPNSGFCTVTVQGNAVIGPDYAMEMTKAGGPDDAGHVFGAGKGIMPENYDYASNTVEHKPRCRANDDSWTWFADIDEYIAFIQTLALSSQTTVNIGDASESNSKPFIKGSVYGGSENGLVQFHTNVYINSGQIGWGKYAQNNNKGAYDEDVWADTYVPSDAIDLECPHWLYGKEEGSGDDKRTVYAPFDPFANAEGVGDIDKYPAVSGQTAKSTEGGRKVASDGHTYYGNVFGGGSGSVPYFDTTEGISKYLHSAGTVKGNTNVTISGGHILTSVYGGCEATNVMGTANVTMTGGTIGVPRTDTQILAHPVTCNLFGAGKGDQRVFFNKDTNVNDAVVTVSGGRIYGSVFGGGEDGHIMRNSTVTISGANTKIGTKGTSYMDGNVFGGGRGFGGDALTAGNVGGAVTLNIENGYVLGSVYGGGRLASVGYGLYLTTETGYGEMRADDVWDDPNKPITSKQTAAEFFDKGRGKITINISGGTIGNDVANAEYGGNVFGGSMGSLTKQDGTLNTQWDKFATAKKTTVNVSGGTIKRSVYGGGELGTVTTDAVITVSGGTIGKPKEGTTVYGGAVYGNIYGGGKGYVDPDGSNYITAGIVKGNTYVTVENSSTTVGETTTTTIPTIYHNIYGGGAYGSVGDFTYDATGMPTARKANTTGGTTNITITGGTIGTDGKENGLIFGSSRGDVDAPGSIQDKLAWVYDTHVTIGTSGHGTTLTTPLIKGSVYGSGENGHTFNDTEVIVHSGTIGIADGEPITDNNGTPDVATDDKTYSGAAYPYRGNVYGGGCGTDKYYQNPTGVTNPYDGNGDTYNPLAGIVYGTTTVTMDGGQVVHNIYGAGAMGSVGKMNTTGAITSGGTTTIEISGGTVGVDGTVDDGNVFGAARGDETTKQTDVALVKTTDVTVSGDATVWGNVYGGGEIGCVGTFTERAADGKYIWTSDDQNLNGLTKVSITGGETKGHVFGAGKGKAVTFKCEKAMVKKTQVSVSNGKVDKNVYGGGEIGRVEEDTDVKIGVGDGTCNPTISGSVYGAGAGLETHGYSALVRHNTTVTVDGGATIGQSVYGGGEIASVGRYGLDEHKMPEILLDGGYCYVKVQGSATIGSNTVQGNVFGACKGVVPHFDKTNADRSKRSRRMTVYTNATDFPEGAKIDATTGNASGTTSTGTTWEYYDESVNPKLVWEYFQEEDGYNKYLETLALATHPEVTIDGGATVNGSVYGGGEMGLTKGSVMVNILGGTITEDVYGGGALANTNTTSAVGVLDNAGIPQKTNGQYQTTTVHPKTTVNLLGGSMRDAYGGGLGQLALAAQGTEGQTGYQAAVPAIEAKVNGNVKVNLNGLQAATDINTTILNSLTTGSKLDAVGSGYIVKSSAKGAVVNRVFGCNNLNGTPTKKVQVYVFGTQKSDKAQLNLKAEKNTNTYDVQAVYGGGNLAPYVPADALLDYEQNKATVDAARPEVYIDGCDLTSIKQVYGGGNAASVPATFVEIRRCYEIDEVFGGGNGYDDYSLVEHGETKWYKNPGANVGYYTGYYTNYATYSNYETRTSGGGSGTDSDPYLAVVNPDYDGDEIIVVNGVEINIKARRLAATDIQYGSGIARLEVKGGTIHTSYGGSNSKGNVRAKLSSVYSAMFDDCEMQVAQSYGGGKNAYSDAETDMVADCAKGVKEMFGGAKDADMNGDINMLITNGSSLERVFGGNNTSGAVNGSITITLKEGGCEPIRIGELYAGGFLAPYSVYGYAKNGDGSYKTELVKYIDDDGNEQEKLQRIPLKKGDEGALSENDRYPDPRINVISATYIGNIFGGGYQAKLVGNPHINVNMEPGRILKKYVVDTEANPFVGEHKDANNNVIYVGKEIAENGDGILEIGTIGNIYGGGNMADIVGDTYVEIGTGTEHNDAGELVAITPARNGAKITGNVFGGGKGKADTFTCEKAMIGIADSPDKTIGNTHVTIANGTVGTLENGKLKEGTGNVYGGGEIGRVENNANVTLGIENGTGPDIRGCVFGAGAGVNTHGYSALVRGNATVLIQGNTKVGQSVYGGGEIASVGRYKVADAAYHAQHPDVEIGLPYSTNEGGICTVTIKGNAEIGPDNMKMVTDTGWPTDQGHVFGAGKGVLPYELTNTTDNRPRRMWRVKSTDTDWNSEWNDAFDGYADADKTVKYKDIWEYYDEEDKEPAYLKYIQSLALTTTTEVTIEGNAFVKGSVYGGSMNGHVQANTHVVIDGDCQIGNGDGVNRRYTTDEWASQSLAECASWPYGHDTGTTDENDNKIYEYLSYDVYDYQPGTTKPKPASDGHTYYGNVFGGGSGLFPYKQDPDWAVEKEALGNKSRKDLGYSDGVWLRSAGAVYGNTHVEIKGGHVLTSVYGGNECTDVKGTTTVEMSGGTLGVPRTLDAIKKHPVTCYLFGAGKGDQRINFNTWTNVEKAIVNITGGHIFGSVFGGGEDGHVLGDVEMTISGASTKIGTTGTSYVDGNIFGGGRGFSGDAQTAGTVGGDINMTISGGEILGSIYGGGRLASVGTEFTDAESPNYGNIVEDGEPIYYTQEDADAYNQENNLTEGMEDYKTTESIKIPATTHGHITINISGGTIGNTVGNAESGNVFGGSMGRLNLLNGNINPIWPKMAQVKETTVTISGDAVIKRNVYGGGELGTVRDNAKVNINGGTVNRDVYGAGYGSKDYETKTKITVKIPKEGVTNPTSASDYDDVSYVFTPMIFAGCVGQNTYVNIAGGKVRKNVYGGGEMASVGIMDCRVEIDNNATDPVYTEGTDKYVYEHFHSHLDENNGFALSWPFHFENAPGYFGATHVNITGGRIGVADGDTDINTDNGDVYGGGKGIAGEYKNYVYCANVGSAEVSIEYPAGNTATPQNYMTNADIECIAGAVYGGAENGHVMGDTKLTLNRGLIGHSMYGGGSGKGTFTTTLNKITGVTVKTDKAPTSTVTPPTQTETTYDAEIYSITAGKVFGNTNVVMNGGYVVRNVYGGGNLGSVGKGNYAGGTDDYSYYNNGARSGYGETLNGNLWDESSDPSKAFMNSGVSNVTINGGTVGYIDFDNVSDYTYSGLPYGNVFGGCRGESAPNIGESPRYLYSPTFFSGYVNETNVTIGAANSSEGPKIWGSVYGGGMDGHVRRDATVTINSGEIGRAYDGDGSADDLAKLEWSQCGNVYGAGSGIGQYNYDFNYDGDYEDVVEYTNPETGRASTVKERDFSTSAGSVTRFTKVEVKGGKIHRNVYGGGSLSSVGAPKIPPTRQDDPIRRNDDDKTTQGLQSLNEVIISGSTTTIGDATSYDNNGNHVYGGFVFGASRGDETLSNPTSFASSVWTDVKVQGGTIYGDVYGGGEVGTVRQGTEVQLTGGVIGSVKGDKVVGGDVFGGGKGTSTVAADIGGDVLVELNKGVADDDPGCVVDRIYGANNINGTPKGHVKVHVYATQNRDLATYANITAKKENVTSPEPPASDFDMTGVFGGGKSSDYVPAESDTKQSTEVIIEGCKLTSIYEVYGGGYGASTPGTNVLINGTKIIDKVFGGGYGKSTTDFPDNPGANVGYRTVGKTLYGSHINDEEKIAIVQLNAGKVNSVFGGSNTLGDIRNGASITTLTSDDAEEGTGDPCDILEVGELYGGGNEAVMEGGAEIVLRCMPDSWIGEVYAGARKADVGNDVSLTITSGKFKQVFGGNKSEGKIDGYVEVNIEECPTCNTPVIIGELYGGGNEAPYKYSKIESDPDYPSPRVNVRAFTSIGTIYGGGKGKDAVVKGNPTVNVSVGMVDGGGQDYSGETRTVDGKDIQLYGHEKGKIGVIGDIFGGGNAAEVDGNTNVFIGTEKYVKLDRIVPGETDVSNYYIRTGTSSNYEYTPVPRTKATAGVTYYQRNPSGTYTEVSVEAGADVSGYYTRSGEEGSYVYTPVNAAEEGKVYCLRVEGVDIRGNVYGGGNAAKVTGNTNVVVGKKTEE